MGSSGKSGGTSSPLTTKGDVWGYSTVNARIPVGSDTQVLTADSTQTLGVKWAATSATASNLNEVQAAALVNATSTGDAGSRADHFTGSVLSGNWTVADTATHSQTVANSAAGWVRTGTGGTINIYQTYTPTGAFRVEARVRQSCTILVANGVFASCGPTLYVADSVARTHNIQIATQFPAQDQWQVAMVNEAAIQGNQSSVLRQQDSWYYLAISRDGSNHWNTYISFDRCLWIQIGTANFAETFTAAIVGFLIGGAGNGGGTAVDFFDVVT